MQTVRATAELVPMLLDRMGPERVAWLQRATAGQAEAAIIANIESSLLTWCGIGRAGVVTMGGVMPTDDPETGYLWQFVADIASHKRDYIEQHRAVLALLLARFPRLVTIIEADYPAALRHLRRLGFGVGPVRDVRGVPACFCERVR
jgi:hypothetical protein